ncbi:nucleotide-binding protein [Solidesulfovibrio carbinolicus]|uniref:Carbon monoxide dehydrogenase n=1 Tax=Solidesulfovibrio carbinolicus TaxID=296842 RepID=A0A4P6HL36_9BACT|nr:ArsA-related P-loop ATPase [Solidesulfovibrio carbinolicus]QAZ67887.1 carbon monoxide dehydrogenase [Solidesulfovibrio carbinolicus]
MNDNPVSAPTAARLSLGSWNASPQGQLGSDDQPGLPVRKIAFAGKGGVGKTALAALFGDWLARSGQDVTLIDADTALSLGAACGLEPAALPASLAEREDLVRERIGDGVYLNLTPRADDLPEAIRVAVPVGDGPLYGPRPGDKRLLVMGGVSGGGAGCACAAGHLLQAMLAHVLTARDVWTLIDCEAGVEHLGRGTVADVDALCVVSEASARSLAVAGRVAAMAGQLGLTRQVLVVTGVDQAGLAALAALPPTLPDVRVAFPFLPGLAARQATTGNVLSLPEGGLADAACAALAEALGRV